MNLPIETARLHCRAFAHHTRPMAARQILFPHGKHYNCRMERSILYENIVIGSFLFEVGVHIGRKTEAPSALSVNLLQQTPLDQSFGDVLLANNATCRLIEFKRDDNESDKEIQKRDLLDAFFQHHEIPKYWFTLSRLVHWYASIDERHIDEGTVGTTVRPYLDFNQPGQSISLSQFAASISDDASREPNE